MRSITIDVSPEEVARSAERHRAFLRLEVADRPPVVLGVENRWFLPRVGVSFREYFASPALQVELQLQRLKTLVEEVGDDRLVSLDAITVLPEFENVVNSAAMGCEIHWDDVNPPRAIPFVRTPDEASRLEPVPLEGSFWEHRFRFREAMRQEAARWQVHVAGRTVPVKVAPAAVGGEGPFLVAVDMVGPDLFWWLYEYPEAVKRLLLAIRTSMLEAERRLRSIQGVPASGGFGCSEDPAQMIGPEQFEEFVVPHLAVLYDELGGPVRMMHMCGDSLHLHRILTERLRITDFMGFGSEVPPARIAETMGGRVRLSGNIDPVLLKTGPPESIRGACREALAALGPLGGWILQDGYNVCPDTPVEHMRILVEEAERYAEASA